MEATIRTLDELSAEAARFVRSLSPLLSGATLVTFSGELGAGKTAFVQAAAKALGVDEPITSPTFVLEKIYLLSEGTPFRRLVHIDAYRLDGADELAALGFDELMKDRETLIMLEWPENVGLDRRGAWRISIKIAGDGSRVLTYGSES